MHQDSKNNNSNGCGQHCAEYLNKLAEKTMTLIGYETNILLLDMTKGFDTVKRELHFFEN